MAVCSNTVFKSTVFKTLEETFNEVADPLRYRRKHKR